MIKGGKGGANTNKTGLAFEKATSLEEALRGSGFNIEDFKIYQATTLKGELAPKNRFYRFLEARDVDWKSLISAKLLPDDAVFSVAANQMAVVETKWQQVSGSTDEKLQTVGFKVRQYTKLLKEAGVELKFIYLLSDWFTHPRYADVLQYIVDSGASYHFMSVPLEELEL